MSRDPENLNRWQAQAREKLRADPVRHGRYKEYLSKRHKERSATDPAYVEERRKKNREYMRKLRMNPARKQYDRQQARIARERDIVKALWKSARDRAKTKGAPFDVTLEDLREIWTGSCALTGIPFRIGDGHQHLLSPSLDKVTPSLGYVRGNCRFILSAVNSFKGAGSDDEMYAIAAALLSNRNRPWLILRD